MPADTRWSAVSALAAIVGLILPLFLFILSRDTKELTVETVSSATLVDLSNPALSSLKLTYKDVPVSLLSVATIEIRNSGTRAIDRSNFEQPVILRFANQRDVLAVTVSENKPSDLKPIVSSDPDGISIAPLLLNPGDQFRISVQLRGAFDEPTVEARISGVPSIHRKVFRAVDSTQQGMWLIVISAFLSWVYFYFSFHLASIIIRRRPFALVPSLESLIIGIGALLASATLFRIYVKTFEIEKSEILYGTIITLLVIMMFAVICHRRSWRLWSMFRPL